MTTTSSSIRAAERPSAAGQYVSSAKSMPSLISSGSTNEFSRVMIGRSCRLTPTPWPNCSPNASISSANPNSSAFGHTAAIWSVDAPRLHEVDRGVHPLARALERVALRRGRAADDERAVVAGPVAVEDVDDVEVRLVARADQPVGEDVRVRAAPLARDRVDRLDELRAHLEQARVRERHDVALADARLQRLEDVLVDAVDHRAGLRQQHDLVRALDLAGDRPSPADRRGPSMPASAAARGRPTSRRRRRRAACRPRRPPS